jgi:uncharacterized protein (TIGR02217 family)
MAFFEQQFPPEISSNMQGGPRFLNDKAFSAGGQRITNRRSQYPLHEFMLAHPVQEGDLFAQLRAFFYVVGGDADGFRFKDWSDYKALASQTSATLVSAGVYQLNKDYTFGARTFTRPIYKPLAGALIYRTRSAVVSDITGASTLDTTTGRVTVTGHVSGDAYTWSGEFDLPVAFKDPMAVFRVIGSGARMLTEWPSIDVEEIRV